MWDVKACAVCFSTDGKLYNMDIGTLKMEYFTVSGLKAKDMVGLPQYLCVECSAYVKRFNQFRDKCKRAHFTLKELLKSDNQITNFNLQAINREHLGIMPYLSFLDENKTYYVTTKFKWEKHNRLGAIIDESMFKFTCSTSDPDMDLVVPKETPRPLQVISDIKEEVQELVNIEYNNSTASNNVATQSTSIIDDSFNFDNDFDYDNDNDQTLESLSCKSLHTSKEIVGEDLGEEYAIMTPLTTKEAKAAVEICKMFTESKYRCAKCNKGFSSETRCHAHERMHNQHSSGNFHCELCDLYYKTEFLLKTHVTEKHMYKYECRKCPEVNFDRMSAKQHYILQHLQKRNKTGLNWNESRPKWLSKKGGKRVKGVVTLRPTRQKRFHKLPDDFPIYTPVSHEEQYQLVEDRKKSRNYLEAMYKCELCYRGFRESNTYGNHMKKHDPSLSGKLQCDMCKIYFHNQRKMYKHMNITHLFKYSCQVCNYVCYNRAQAHIHYRWHKNVTYPCPHCKQEFKKASTRLTHVRIKHPSTYVCNLCGHSFVSENGLYCHKRLAHSMQEIESSEAHPSDPTDSFYCAECDVQFLSEAAYKTHLGSSNKHVVTNVSTKPKRFSRTGVERKPRGRPRFTASDIVNNGVATSTQCEVCNKFLANDVQARKHYESEHPGAEYLKRYMCDVCGHTTRQYANLMVHMRTHTQEKPYGCPHCDRRFSMPSNRDRHLVVHTGEKRYQCQHCSRRFTQSSAVKLHIQTVHLKIPYAPWDKNNRKRRKLQELEQASMSTSLPPPVPPPVTSVSQHKIMLDAQGDYLNAYITYNDE